jgi:hypothetical protein
VVGVKYRGKHASRRYVSLSPYKGERIYIYTLSEPRLHELLVIWDEAVEQEGSVA